ncbi:MAG: thiaminase II [Pseudomonadota bacterium]|nr:thiaminase II [Pseudomonadota bacterium]
MREYGKTFKLWKDAAGSDWDEYTKHPFVQKLADGSLPKENFVNYLIQDYVFLIHFSRAWALAITKAETLQEMRLCAATVNALVNEEISLHVKLCANEGIKEADLFNAIEATPNLAYTRYVLDAGHSGDFLDLIAALAPCVLGYGEIGFMISKTEHSSAYSDWISTYSAKEYQSVCADVGKLIDEAVAIRLGENPIKNPRWHRLTNRFLTATRLEVGFWQMGLDI